MTGAMWLFVAIFAVMFVIAVIDSGSKRHRKPSRGWKGRR